jgi:hypothetical protein
MPRGSENALTALAGRLSGAVESSRVPSFAQSSRFSTVRVSMVGGLAMAAVKTALAAWLLLTNLSLGLYHRHEMGQDAHRAAPTGWHYHVLLLGVELDFLSVNSETCPFQNPTPADAEAHLLLGHLVAATDHDIDLSSAVLNTLMPLPIVPTCAVVELPATDPSFGDHWHGLPSPAAALSARSGVQQI